MEGIFVALAASAVSFAALYLLLTRRIRKLVDPDTILAQIRREVEELIVELNNTTERNISLMEQKLKTLSGVLQKVEKRLAVLRREAAAIEQSERVYAALRRPPDLGADLPPVPSEPQVAPLDSEEEAAPEPSAVPEENVRARVVSLHRAGISADSIARKVKLSRAKVELIVSLEEEGQP
jgi:hypothetical protein